MKKNLLLKNLESFNNYKVYSKTNGGYEKVLGNFTLKSFIKSLKSPKKIKKPSFLEEMAMKYPDEDDPLQKEIFIFNKRKNVLNEFLNKINDESYIQVTKSIEKNKKSNLILNYKKPINIEITPTPWTYNPKYDLIFKRTPITIIYNTPKKNENNNHNHNLINNSEGNNSLKIKNLTELNNDYKIMSYKGNKERKKLRLKSLKIINNKIKSNSNSKEKIKKDNNEDNNKEKIFLDNLEYKYNNLIKEKIDEKSNNDIYNNKSNNINIFNYINKKKTPYKLRNNNISLFQKNNSLSKTSISNKKRKLNAFFRTNPKNNSEEKKHKNNNIKIFDFSKMSKRNFDILLNNSVLKNPSFYRYKPNFDYIKQSPKVINFGTNDNRTNFQKKRYLLKKMWCSYANLTKDYILINNSKLNETKN